VPVSELSTANQLEENASLEGIEALVVPVPPAVAASTHGVLYTSRRGDTLVSIADRFGVSLSQLRRWNNLAGFKVAPGRRLRVAEPAHVVRTRATSPRRGSAASASLHDPAPKSKTGSGAPAPRRRKGTGRRSATGATPPSRSKSSSGAAAKRKSTKHVRASN
jgi:membrane-bound lytic murein transglycosylase D